MSEDILLSFEGHRERTAIAAYFRQLADGLDGDGAVTFSEGDESVILRVPDTPEFEVEIEREQEDDEIEYEIELELEWSADASADEEFTIEAGEPSEADTPTADDEQETIDEAVEGAEGGHDTDESEHDADETERPPPDSGETRSEVDAAEDDEESQQTDGGAVGHQQQTETPVVTEAEPQLPAGQFEVFVDRRGQWRWRLRRDDGEVIAMSTEGHDAREAATAEVTEIQDVASRSPVIVEESE